MGKRVFGFLDEILPFCCLLHNSVMKGVDHMNITVNKHQKELLMKFERFNDQGKNVGEVRRIKNFKVLATPEDLYEVSTLIAALSEQPVDLVSIEDVSTVRLA